MQVILKAMKKTLKSFPKKNHTCRDNEEVLSDLFVVALIPNFVMVSTDVVAKKEIMIGLIHSLLEVKKARSLG
jgi:hypothetical protein